MAVLKFQDGDNDSINNATNTKQGRRDQTFDVYYKRSKRLLLLLLSTSGITMGARGGYYDVCTFSVETQSTWHKPRLCREEARKPRG